MDIVFAGAGGGISGGCFELTEPALICEGYHSEVCVKSSWPSAGLPFRGRRSASSVDVARSVVVVPLSTSDRYSYVYGVIGSNFDVLCLYRVFKSMGGI